MWSERSPEVASDKAEAVGVGHESLAHLRQLPHSSATLSINLRLEDKARTGVVSTWSAPGVVKARLARLSV